MKAEELRIGNWIKEQGYISKPVYLKVNLALLGLIIVNSERYTDDPEDELYYGIPLTPELLVKAGFVKLPHRGGYSYDQYELNFTNFIGTVKEKIILEYLDTNMWLFLEGNTLIHIYTLHELQNFYYVFSNKQELNIQL